MTRKIFFLDRAVADIKIAYDWYEEQQNGLGKRFEESVQKTVAEIAKFPFAYPDKFKKSRETLIPKFLT
jgi:plasmid stabilization system protein ParE